MQDVGSWGDRIRAEEELQSSLLRSSYQSIGCRLITGDIHITALHLVLRFYTIGGRNTGMHVMSIIVTCLHHLNVILCNLRLLGKFLLEEVAHQTEVSVEKPAHQSEGKHIPTLQYRLVVHPTVTETVFHHLGDGTRHHTIFVDAHLCEIVLRGKLCLLQVFRTEAVGINNNGCLGFSILILRLERSSIHSNQHITTVARGIYLTGTDMHLKSRNTCE